ncbi:MAG: acyl-CoA thioesterase [Paracoccaceae bacterium]|nr:acyl-CoA thioesterase [Paracoccaceae bacterium]
MYPVIRLLKETYVNRRRAPLAVGETHVTHMRAWPWDIDIFLDLNNGRILTLMDLGRFGLFVRIGILKVMKERGWYGTVAGSAVRYRRRITVMQKLELRTKVIGWDDRFTYFDQSFWQGDTCCTQAIIRTAITTGKGIIPTSEVAQAMGFAPESPPLPDWVAAWAKAERERTWPPER